MRPFEVVFIGLGSNMQQPLAQLHNALNHLADLPDSKLLASSSFYASRPMGPQDQPDYVNAVAKLKTALAPLELLRALQTIELTQGRERKGERWGPRTLDLDILLFGQQQIQTAELTVPHYGMKSREFVLYPLFELAPELLLPCGNSLKSILNNVSRNGLHIIEQAVTR